MTLAMLISSWDRWEEASFPIGVPSASSLPFHFLFSPGLPQPGGFACRRCEQSAGGFMFASLCVPERKKERTVFNPTRGFLRVEVQVLWLG